jgi:hypothetical protein
MFLQAILIILTSAIFVSGNICPITNAYQTNIYKYQQCGYYDRCELSRCNCINGKFNLTTLKCNNDLNNVRCNIISECYAKFINCINNESFYATFNLNSNNSYICELSMQNIKLNLLGISAGNLYNDSLMHRSCVNNLCEYINQTQQTKCLDDTNFTNFCVAPINIFNNTINNQTPTHTHTHTPSISGTNKFAISALFITILIVILF